MRTQLPKAQLAAFDQRIAATNAFAKARGDETEVSGTARGVLVGQAEAREKEWLREHLAAFEKGTFKAAPQPLSVVDAERNRVYKALMTAPVTDQAQPDRLEGSAVTPGDSLTAILTDWRVKQLKRM